jgi:hypothetical protein
VSETADSSGPSPILPLARELRHAERARAERLERPLKLYDGAAHQRLEPAVEFLRALQNADAEYEAASQRALEAYRERIEGE